MRDHLVSQNMTTSTSPVPDPFPTFDSLPLDPSGPPGNAWGLFGSNDQLGMLNLLTPSTVRLAAQENILEGIRIPLDWPLNKPAFPTFAREKFHHVVQHKSPQPGVAMNDDFLSFNTQSSTQWDGFRHYGYQKSGEHFGGHVQSDFVGGKTELGIHCRFCLSLC
jgi:hypothetical protein